MVIIEGVVNNESPKLGGREVFIGGGGRCDNRFVSYSTVVGEGLVSGQRRHNRNPS